MTDTGTQPWQLVVVSAGNSEASSTRLLAGRIAQQVSERSRWRNRETSVHTLDLRELATEITTALVSQLVGPKLQAAVDALERADGIIVSTPVYKAGPSGLLTSFFQVLDDDLLIAKPVILAATAGTARHALVVDDHLRPMFAYMRTITAPTSLFASTEDWNDPTLTERIDRAAVELVLLMDSGFAEHVRDESWRSYQHQYGSAGGTELDIDLDTDLMRLATGGPPPK